jgi:hypothetical protein
MIESPPLLRQELVKRFVRICGATASVQPVRHCSLHRARVRTVYCQ